MFKTYGTPRVYVEQTGQYHEPLFATATCPEDARRIADALNAAEEREAQPRAPRAPYPHRPEPRR